MGVRRGVFALACTIVVAGGCNTDAPTESLPGACGGIDEVAPGGDATFVAGDRLYAVNPGGDIRCLLEAVGDGEIAWGPPGDRVAVGRTVFGPGDRVVETTAAAKVEWSHPTGRSVVWIDERRRLWKRTDDDEPKDISFLARHDEVVYHRAGTHLTVAGEDPDGRKGIFIATNLGADPLLLAEAERARRVHDLAAGGWNVAFLADHGDVHHLHVPIPEQDWFPEVEYESDGPLGRLVTSPFLDPRGPPRTAFRVGDCDESTHTIVWLGGEMGPRPLDELDGRSTEPVGWLEGDVLVVSARDRGCDGPADLYVWDGSGVELLVRGVDRAAVRVVAPDAPSPPTLPGRRPADDAPA